MKKLSEVTEEDARQIIRAGYPSFFQIDNWKFKDDSEALGEPCKCLYSKRKAYDFTFYDNDISTTRTDDDVPLSFDGGNFDTKIECFVEAHNLGYFVPKLSKLKTLTDEEIEVKFKLTDFHTQLSFVKHKSYDMVKRAYIQGAKEIREKITQNG